MAQKNHKAQAAIQSWIKAQDPDFAAAIEDAGHAGYLTPGKYGVGVTFLYFPGMTEEYTQLAYTDKKAAKTLLLSYILPDFFPSVESFAEKAVGSRNGAPYEVKESKSDARKGVARVGGVALMSGGAPNADSKVAVWMAPAAPKASGGTYHIPKRPADGGRPAARGLAGAAAAGGDSQAASSIVSIVSVVDSGAVARSKRGQDPCEAYAQFFVCLFKAMGDNDKIAILPMMQPGGVGALASFLAMTNLSSSSDIIKHIIIYAVVRPGFSFAAGSDEAFVPSYNTLLRSVTAQSGEYNSFLPNKVPFVFGSTLNLIAPNSGPGEIGKTYADVVTKNSFSGSGPIWPEETLSIWRELKPSAGPGKCKRWLDELFFTVSVLVGNRVGSVSIGTVKDIIQEIAGIFPGRNVSNETKIADCETPVRCRVTEHTERFLDSKYYLYLPAGSAGTAPANERASSERASSERAEPESAAGAAAERSHKKRKPKKKASKH